MKSTSNRRQFLRNAALSSAGLMIVPRHVLGGTGYTPPGDQLTKAIIGVGCLTEVKEGLEMADKLGLVAMGVVNLKEGCVETIANWQEIYEIAVLGIDQASIPEDLHTLTD